MARTTNLRECYDTGFSSCLEKVGASVLGKYLAKKLSLNGRGTPKSLAKHPGSTIHKDYKELSGLLKETSPKGQKGILGILANNHIQ